MNQIQQNLAGILNLRSKELYNLTVQYGQACLLNDKDKASYYWQTIIEGYKELEKLIDSVHKIEIAYKDTADILSDLDE